jgi:hypothetical protein
MSHSALTGLHRSRAAVQALSCALWEASPAGDTYRMKGRTFSISARLAASGKAFTAGCVIGQKINLSSPCLGG